MTTENTNSLTDQALAQIAQALGEDPNTVKLQQANWTKLLQDGVLVSLHVRRWRATARLTWEDLGLPDMDKDEQGEIENLLRLGEKYLMPSEMVKKPASIEQAARNYLAENAYKTHWGYFCPPEAYAKLKARMGEYAEEYMKIPAYIDAHWNELLDQLAEQYATAGRKAYRRLQALGLQPKTGLYATFTWNQLNLEDAFVDRWVDTIMALVPAKQQIVSSFSFEIELNYIPLPGLLAQEQAIAAQARAEIEEAQARTRLVQEQIWAERRIQEQKVRAEQAIIDEKLSAEQRTIREQSARERQLAEMKAQMERDVLEQAKRQKEEQLGGFMRDMIAQLRTLTYEAVTDVLATTEKNGGLHTRSITQLQNLTEKINALNFFGDQEIDDLLQPVKQLLAQAPEQRSTNEVKRALSDIAVITRSALIGLGERPRSARAVGIPDKISAAMVRQARGRLEIAEQAEMPGMERRRARKVEE